MNLRWTHSRVAPFRRHTTLQHIISAGWLAALVLGCSPSAAEPNEADEETSGNEPGTGCTQGAQVACPCGGGQPDGVQVCTSASVWDVCQCTGGNLSGTGGAGSNTGGTGSATGGSISTGGTGSGGVGTGGAEAGTGGLSQGGSANTCDTSVTDMVSDMEVEVPTMPPALNTHATRQGPWYSSHGTGATITDQNDLDSAIPGGRCRSTRAVHAVGNAGATESIAGFDFNSSAGEKTVYSLAAAGTGIAFFAKGTGTIRVELTTTDLDPLFDCVGPECYGYHGSVHTLGAEWTLIEIPFTAFEQAPWSAKEQVVALNLAHAIGLQFKVDDGAFDIWIDDVGFY